MPSENFQDDYLKAVRDADEQLRDAILRSIAARSSSADSRVLVDFVVLTARQGFDDDGDGETSYEYILPDGDTPWHRILGLLKIFEIIMRGELKKGLTDAD